MIRADHPERVYFGIVDQYAPEAGDLGCIEVYCLLANDPLHQLMLRAKGWLPNAEIDSVEGEHAWDRNCPYRSHFSYVFVRAEDSRGPSVARAWGQTLVGEQDFCSQLDAHVQFVDSWDTKTKAVWLSAENEMGIITTYAHDCSSGGIVLREGKWVSDRPDLAYMCGITRGGNGMPRWEQAGGLSNTGVPVLQTQWAAGFSFGKCHSEKRVPIDPHTLWIFDGEEFLRSSHLWTHGYDFYSPHDNTVFHNYSKVAHSFWGIEAPGKARETDLGANRAKMEAGIPLPKGAQVEVFPDDYKYSMGSVRSYAAYLQFLGIDDLSKIKREDIRQPCDRQPRWVPFEDSAAVESLVPGWHQKRPLHQQTNAQGFRFSGGVLLRGGRS